MTQSSSITTHVNPNTWEFTYSEDTNSPPLTPLKCPHSRFESDVVCFVVLVVVQSICSKLNSGKTPTVNIGLASATGKSGRMCKSHLAGSHNSVVIAGGDAIQIDGGCRVCERISRVIQGIYCICWKRAGKTAMAVLLIFFFSFLAGASTCIIVTFLHCIWWCVSLFYCFCCCYADLGPYVFE